MEAANSICKPQARLTTFKLIFADALARAVPLKRSKRRWDLKGLAAAAALLVALSVGCGGGSSSSSGSSSASGPAPGLAAGYVTLYDFGSKTGDGYSPNGIVQDGSGVWYGTTLFGSANAPQPPSNGATGTIFKFALGSGLTSLHGFTTAEGVWPLGLILGSDGNFYGAASEGGMVTTCFFGAGCGATFKLTPQGDFSVLHDFDGTDGESPSALVQGDDGSIYGITAAGGTGSVNNCPMGCGTIFKISPDGSFLVLYNFDGAHGSSPQNLIKASDGTFYGIATLGGTNNNGVFFNITPAGQYTALHDFDFTVVGPYDSIVQASDGNFYGTAVDTGSSCQQGTCSCFAVCGTIFRITPQGGFSVLYNFTDYAQGAEPNSLVQGLDGNFYGAAAGGTADGVLFKLTTQGSYSILYNFDRTNGADAPGANGLIRGSDGNLYGTSSDGGVGNAANGCANGCGVIFGFGLNK